MGRGVKREVGGEEAACAEGEAAGSRGACGEHRMRVGRAMGCEGDKGHKLERRGVDSREGREGGNRESWEGGHLNAAGNEGSGNRGEDG